MRRVEGPHGVAIECDIEPRVVGHRRCSPCMAVGIRGSEERCEVLQLVVGELRGPGVFRFWVQGRTGESDGARRVNRSARVGGGDTATPTYGERPCGGRDRVRLGT